jgi:ribosomal protein S18 acetylase RimI-like enzyme
VIELCRAEGWDSYLADAARTFRALTASGAITMVAMRGGVVCGFAQILTDSEIRAYLTNVAVSAGSRRQGIGTRLIEEAFARAGARYLDLLSDPGAEALYESFAGYRRVQGFRIYPSAPR